jgi:4-carboxymuconolactone decarboxylase
MPLFCTILRDEPICGDTSEETARMKVIKSESTKFTAAVGGIFRGPVQRKPLVGEAQSKQVTTALVKFDAGGRNIFHRHTHDQVLYVTEGEGIVATEQEEITVHAGDVIVIPAGEKHWHGATPHSGMAHITIGTPGTTEAAE